MDERRALKRITNPYILSKIYSQTRRIRKISRLGNVDFSPIHSF